MAGQTLAEQGVNLEVTPRYVSVKEAVFPFSKFLGVDPVLGPEMRSTGEVMGVGRDFGEALFKSQLAAGSRLPERGSVFISVRECDKPKAVVAPTSSTRRASRSWRPRVLLTSSSRPASRAAPWAASATLRAT